MSKIKVLAIESDISFRDFLKQIIESYSDMEMTASSPTGNIGLMKAQQLNPDAVLIDTSITDISILELTRELLKSNPHCGIILMVKKGAPQNILTDTIKALEEGAFDFIEKPGTSANGEIENAGYFQWTLALRIRDYSIKRYSKIVKSVSRESVSEDRLPALKTLTEKLNSKQLLNFDILVIGVSTGGPQALAEILPKLPENFPVPVAIVIHLPALFTASLTEELAKKTKLKVKESEEGEMPQRGFIYLAKGGRHLTLNRSDRGFAFRYNDDPPVNNCRPSVDTFFLSVAEEYKNRAIGVILTGMGEDGAQGIKQLHQNGSFTMAQNKESSVVWGMPGAAVNTGAVKEIHPLDEIILRVLEII